MSVHRIISRAAAAVLAACLLTAALPAVAVGAPQTAASRARVDAAVGRYAAAQSRTQQLDARIRRATDTLDDTVAEQTATQSLLNARIGSMYRSGETGLISVLLGAASFEEFAARWDLLVRIGQEDAAALIRLRALQARQRREVKSLLGLQAQQARAKDALAREVADAKHDLAADQAALAQYAARTVPSTPAPRRPRPVAKQRKGSGAWKTAVASHYGRNFSGRGANGEAIGPYSMIVAHRTLPFGTLIEFEYKGKRAVARVTDRGPHVDGRTFDLGPGVVRVLDFSGVDQVRYRIIKP